MFYFAYTKSTYESTVSDHTTASVSHLSVCSESYIQRLSFFQSRGACVQQTLEDPCCLFPELFRIISPLSFIIPAFVIRLATWKTVWFSLAALPCYHCSGGVLHLLCFDRLARHAFDTICRIQSNAEPKGRFCWRTDWLPFVPYGLGCLARWIVTYTAFP